MEREHTSQKGVTTSQLLVIKVPPPFFKKKANSTFLTDMINVSPLHTAARSMWIFCSSGLSFGARAGATTSLVFLGT